METGINPQSFSFPFEFRRFFLQFAPQNTWNFNGHLVYMVCLWTFARKAAVFLKSWHTLDTINSVPLLILALLLLQYFENTSIKNIIIKCITMILERATFLISWRPCGHTANFDFCFHDVSSHSPQQHPQHLPSLIGPDAVIWFLDRYLSNQRLEHHFQFRFALKNNFSFRSI